jgi:Repeat of unknown function (DUF5648)
MNGIMSIPRRLLSALALIVALLLPTAAPAATIFIDGNPTYTYDLDTGLASFTVYQIENTSFSGPAAVVRLELWAFALPYTGSPQPGYLLATCPVASTLPPLTLVMDIRCKALPFSAPPDGNWTLALLVSEYTGTPTDGGYEARDYRSYSPTVAFGKAPPPSPLVAVEYYWASRDHYFITAAPAEIAALDAGPPDGWVRTGASFPVYDVPAAGQSPVPGRSPVCRFYLPPPFGDSHYYSASPDECAAVKAKYPGFVYESPSVFYIVLPDTLAGVCPPGTAVVYRLWNQRADTNHRYTTSPVLVQQMLARGYVLEGYGLTSASMCAPSYGSN